MSYRSLTGAAAAVLACALMMPAARADDPKYPNWKGQWDTINPRYGGQAIKYDPTKAWGPAQQAPLTPEYQKVLQESMADQARGGLGNYPTARCLPGGMPRMMASPRQEYIVTPETTYVAVSNREPLRRIFTDGRDWPTDLDPAPSYGGYSIGRWIDEDGDGVYDVLLVETRAFKGPRSVDETGLPMHVDNQSIFKERIWRDKINPRILHDEMTIIDHAFTRPWTVDKRYVHNPNPRPEWTEFYTTENNAQLKIGKENYFLSWDGLLMPAKKNQPPPDLRYFKETK